MAISVAHAQSSRQEHLQNVIDSIQGLLIQAENDSLKARYYLQLSGAYRNTNRPTDARQAVEKSIEIAKAANLRQMTAAAYRSLGRIEQEQGNHSSSVKQFQAALEIWGDTGFISQRAFDTQLLGKAYEFQQLYDVADSSYQKAYRLIQTLPDDDPTKPGQVAFVLNNLGNVSILMDSINKGLAYQKASIQIRQQSGDSLNLGYSYNDIAGAYARLDSLGEAKKYYEFAWNIFMGMGKKRELAFVGGNLAGIYLQNSQTAQAEKYGLEAIERAYQIQDKQSISTLAGLLSAVYDAKQNYRKAFEYHQVYANYRDSVINEQQLREMGRMESALELKAKEAENQKQETIIDQQRTTNIVIGSSLLVVLFLAGLLLRSQQQQKKANKLLQSQNEEISHQKETLAEQAASLQEANEEINQQKEEIYAQAETLRKVNEEIQEKNALLTSQNSLIDKKNKDLTASINYASRIQSALLPFPQRLEKAFQEHFVFFKPKDIVSGDFYWYGQVGHKEIIAVIDCTGHGVPGAFMSMLGYGALDDVVLRQQITSPAAILLQLDKQIQQVLQQEQTSNKDGMDAAICVIDKENNTLEFAGAKNPLLLIQGNSPKVIKGDTFSIGGFHYNRQEKEFTNHQIPLDGDATYYLYSDGYQDQFGGPRDKKFLAKRFRDLLFDNHQQSLGSQKELLDQALTEWMGEQRQIDDILVVGFKP